ncbi:MAG: hypothetical protein RLZZ161_59, partial [Bacteroidota bacterium]
MKNVDNKSNIVIKETPDGSYTFQLPDLNETYHSINGAKTESQYVYIDQGISKCNSDPICVFEMGYGSGLNAFLTWKFAVTYQKKILYTAVEKYPISAEILKIPDFIKHDKESEHIWKSLHNSDWNTEIKIDTHFVLLKNHNEIEEITLSGKYDIVYYDAFAPSVQPELWSCEIFQKIFDALKPGGILVTYSSAGAVKRALVSVGFQIERLQGPPGKKHMLRGTKSASNI